MSSPSSPSGSWRLAGLLVLVAALAATVLAGWQVAVAPTPPPRPQREDDGRSSGSTTAAATKGWQPEAFARVAWQQPEAAAVSQAATRKPELKAVAMLVRDGRRRIAFERGKGQPLLYLAEGESRDGVTLVAVTGNRVEVQCERHRLQLEVGR